jgi:DNA-binding HxlR family transcriptional regulator
VARSRTSTDACTAAHALDLIGERWALLVVRELLLGPRRFTDLRTGISGISPNVLGQRLRDLETAGVVRRDVLPPPAASRVYALTPWGQELEPAVLVLTRWGGRSPAAPQDGHLSAAALALALRAGFAAERAAGVTASCELRLGADVLAVTISQGTVRVDPGPAVDPVFTLSGPAAVLHGVLQGRLGLTGALSQGALSVQGSRAAARRFLSLFVPAPAPASSPASASGPGPADGADA